MEEMLQDIEQKSNAVKMLRKIESKIQQLVELGTWLANGDVENLSLQFKYEKSGDSNVKPDDSSEDCSPFAIYVRFGGGQGNKKRRKRVSLKCDEELMLVFIELTIKKLTLQKECLTRSLLK
jgi:hypothetical protein